MLDMASDITSIDLCNVHLYSTASRNEPSKGTYVVYKRTHHVAAA